MIQPVGAPHASPMRCAWVRRCFTRLKKALHDAGPQHQCRRRGRLRAEPEIRRRGARLHHPRDREDRLSAGRGHLPRARSAPPREFYHDGRYVLDRRGQDARCRRHGRLSRRSRGPLSDRLDRGRAAPRMTGTAGSYMTERLGGKRAARRRRHLRHQPRAAGARPREQSANAILIKLNQIGTLTETLETMEMAHIARAGAAWSAIARARPRTRPSPIWRLRPIAGRSRPAAWRAASAPRNTTSSSASSRNSDRPRGSQGAPRCVPEERHGLRSNAAGRARAVPPSGGSPNPSAPGIEFCRTAPRVPRRSCYPAAAAPPGLPPPVAPPAAPRWSGTSASPPDSR